MEKKHLRLALLLAMTLMGCRAISAQPEKYLSIEQSVCCADYRQFAWIPLTGEKLDIAIDSTSPVAEFEQEKNHFAAFAIPENINRLQVTLNSWMSSKGVFAPKVMLLNSKFKVVETFSLDDFTVSNGDMFHLSSYQMHFVMARDSTPYLVIYSPLSYQNGAVSIAHPERLRAEELGMARPMVIDPVIKHRNAGALTLTLKPLNLRAYRLNEIPSKSDRDQTKQSVKSLVTPQIPTPKIMKETEAFYNEQISKAIENDDLAQALKWLEEAKRAGSKTAESTFINQVKP